MFVCLCVVRYHRLMHHHVRLVGSTMLCGCSTGTATPTQRGCPRLPWRAALIWCVHLCVRLVGMLAWGLIPPREPGAVCESHSLQLGILRCP